MYGTSSNSEQLYRQLTDWYRQPARQAFSERIRSMAGEWLADSFGYYTLEISSFDHNVNWFENSIRSYFRIGTSNPSLVSTWGSLPIDSESIDLVIINHILEFSDQPHHLLKETDRILIPEGKLLVILFNPLGTQGLMKRFLHHRGAPWSGRFYSMQRLKDWFTVCGFDIIYFRYAVAPFSSFDKVYCRISKKLERYVPWLCSLYMIYAVKRVSSIRLVGNTWKHKNIQDRGLEPTASIPDTMS